MARGRKSNSINQSDFTNSTNPQDLERRLFIGNLPTDHMTREEMQEIFSKYGKIRALSMYHGYGFVQYDRLEDVQAALDGEKGRLYKGYRLDIKKAVERRNMNKASSRSSPARSTGCKRLMRKNTFDVFPCLKYQRSRGMSREHRGAVVFPVPCCRELWDLASPDVKNFQCCNETGKEHE